MKYIKTKNPAYQPNENIAKKRNRIDECTISKKEENLASHIPQPERAELLYMDYLHSYLCGNKQISIHWGLSPQKMKLVSFYFNQPFPSFQKQLRIYDINAILFDGNNAFGFQEVNVHGSKGFLIIEGLKPGCSYCLELGIVLKRNKFFPLIRSNTINTTELEREAVELSIEKRMVFEYSKPNWLKSVSTYTLYDNINHGWSFR